MFSNGELLRTSLSSGNETGEDGSLGLLRVMLPPMRPRDMFRKLTCSVERRADAELDGM